MKFTENLKKKRKDESGKNSMFNAKHIYQMNGQDIVMSRI